MHTQSYLTKPSHNNNNGSPQQPNGQLSWWIALKDSMVPYNEIDIGFSNAKASVDP